MPGEDLHERIAEQLPDGLDRRQFVAGAGASLAAATAGCFGNGGDGDGDGDSDDTPTATADDDGGYDVNQIHILMDYANEAWQERWDQELVPGFEEESGLSVDMEYVGFQGSSEQRLQTLMQSGDFPNSYQGSTTETADIIVSGNAVPVTDVNEDIQETNGEFLFEPGVLSYGGDQWYIPHLIYSVGTVSYRQDIYDDLGLSPPETWDDLLSNAEAIDASGNTDARGYNVAGKRSGQATSEFITYLRNNGGGVFDWRSGSEEEAEVWFDEDTVLETLAFMDQLAQYSPSPSQTSWTSSLQYWGAGRVAQCWHLNAWTAEIAHGAGLPDLARATDFTLTPMNSGADPIDRGFISPDGATLLDTEGAAATKDFFRYVYGSQERTIQNHLMSPMRSFPANRGLMEQDAYRNAEVFQAYDGHLYDLNRRVGEEVIPELSSPERPSTAATNYTLRYPMLAEMVNRVIVANDSPQAAYQEARDSLETRLAEGKELAAQNLG